MRRLARRAGLWAGGLLALFLLTAFGLALVPAPKLTFPLSAGGATALPCAESAEVRCVAARDGVRLALRRNPAPPPTRGAEGAPVVLLLHGVLASGAEPAIAEAARKLEGAAGASVYRLDLRDHGLSASRRREDHLADLDHIGQFEEDVADVLAHLRREHPEAPLVLARHSMGGGIALHPKGETVLVPGASHDGVLTDPRSTEAAATWLRALAAARRGGGGNPRP